jgi:MOSC domain-containing protein YiiM/biotin operon repressor
LHAVSHPLRVRILDELREPASAAEVARRLGESRQNVNYHLKELERGGLVYRVGERRAGGFVESLYRASATAVVVTSAGPWPLVDCDASSSSVNANPLSFAGTLVSIHVAPAAETSTVAVGEARAVPGRGLEGDRYFDGAGTFSDHPGDGRDVTLIELEVLEALRGESGIDLSPGDSRRNLVTCGVPLNHLVGRELRIGKVVLRGARLCEPCAHLARLTEPGVLPGLVHRGGLRADIVRGGLIRVGDEIGPA